MSNQETAQKKLVEIISSYQKPSLFTKIFFVFLILVVLLAVYCVYLQLIYGQVVTGLRDYVACGIYAVSL